MRRLVPKILAVVLALVLVMGLGSVTNAALVVIQIINGLDDHEESLEDGSMDVGSSDLELGTEGPPDPRQAVGLRFQSVGIDPYATIMGASIQFTVDETDTEVTNLRIYGELTPNAAQYADTAFNITSRTNTSNSVVWSDIPEWNTTGEAGPDQQTPDLTPIVQEIVDQAAWVSGNAMAFMIFPDPLSDNTGERTAESYEGSSSDAAVLTVDVGPTLFWNGDAADWEDSPQHWLTDPANPLSISPTSPDATTGAVMSLGGTITVNAPLRSAYRLKMTGVAMNVVLVSGGTTLDIVDRIDAAGNTNFIVFSGDQARLNSGTGNGAIGVMTTDIGPTGSVTVNTGGDLDVGVFVDEGGAMALRTLNKEGPGTLALGTEGAVVADFTTLVIHEGTLAVHGGNLGGSPEVQFLGSQLDLFGAPSSIPGLLLDQQTGDMSFAPNQGNLGIDPDAVARITETNALPPWADNTTFVYTGQINAPGGPISFFENIDDKTRLWIDDVLILNNDQWDEETAATVNLTAGWHDFELRMSNGGGGAGNEEGPRGFGVAFSDTGASTDPALYSDAVNPDPAVPSLFRVLGRGGIDLTAAGTKFVVDTDSGSTFNAITDGDVLVPFLELKKGILEVKVTTGNPTPGTVTFGQTVIPPGTTGTVGVDFQAPTDLGALNANNNDVTIVKLGPYDWTLDAGNTNLAGPSSQGTILEVQGGRIISVDLAGVGDATLAAKLGAEFVLESTGADLLVDNPIDGGAVGALGDPTPTANNQLSEEYFDIPLGDDVVFNQPLEARWGLLALPPTNTRLLDRGVAFPDTDTAPRHAAERPLAVETYDFAVAWRGWLAVGGPNAPAGDWTFETDSDDDSVVFIDLNGDGDFNDSGELIVDNDGGTLSGSVTLAPGAYPFLTAYYERDGDDRITASFTTPEGTKRVINPNDSAQAGIWGTDYQLTPAGPELGLLTAGQPGGPGVDVVLNNFNPAGVIGLNAMDGSRFVIPNVVNTATGGFAVIAGETEIRENVTVDFFEIRSGATLSNPLGKVISVTGNMLLGGGSLDLTGLPVAFGPASIVVVGDGQSLTIDPAFDGGTLQLYGSGQLKINGPDKGIKTREGLTLRAGATLDMTGRTLDTDGATVSIGRGAMLVDDDPLIADGLVVLGSTVDVPAVILDNQLTVSSGLDLTGIPLTLGASGEVTVNQGGSLTADDSLVIDKLNVDNGTVTLGGGAGSVTLGSNPTLGNGATINADLGGNVDLTINVGEQGVISLLGPGTVVYDDTTIDKGGLEVSPDAASLGSGRLQFDADDNNHQSVLISRDSVPGTPGFTREMGEGDGQVYWDHDGGFAARGGPFTISLTVGGTPNGTVKADGDRSNGFDDERLMLGHWVADSLVTLTNPIEMDDNLRIEVGNNPNTDQDVGRLTGVIANPSGDTTGRELMHDSNDEEGTLWLDPRDPVTGNPVANTWYGELEIDEGTVRALDGFGLSKNANLKLDGDSDERVAGVFESWDESDWEAAKAANDAAPGSVPMPGFRRNVGSAAGEVNVVSGGFAAWDNPDTPEVEVLHVTLNAAGPYDVKGPTLEWDAVWGDLDDNKFVTGSRTANSMVTYTNDINGHANGEDNEFHMFDNPHSDGDVTRLTGVLTLPGSLEMDDVGAAAGGVLWLDPRDADGNPTQNVLASGGDGVDIEEGVLRAVDGFGLDVDSELNFSGGDWYEVRIFESYDTDPNDPTTGFRRQIDPDTDDGVDWDISAGFSAFDNPDTPEVEVLHVTLNPSGPADPVGAVISWDDDFEDNVLQLNSPHANSVVIVTNPIDFADDDRNVIVWDNPFKESDWAEIAGVMSGLAQDDFSKHGPGKLVLSADNTYGGATTVTDGILVLTGTNSYMGGTYMAGGTVVAASSASLGGGPLVFNGGGLELMDTFGSATRLARIGDAGATVNTPAGTSLTLNPAGGALGGGLAKDGPGLLVLNIPVGGNVDLNEGVLQVGEGVLGQATPGGPPRVITLGALTTLNASGYVNGLVVDAGGLMSPSTLQAVGPMVVGVLGSTAGYNYAGILDAGPHSVVLLDDDKADVGLALIAGGSLTGAKGIQLNPMGVGFGGFITGDGEIHGVVTAGEPGNPAVGFGGLPPGITVYGDVAGLWNQFDNTTVTGKLQAGFSPAHNPLGPGSNAGTAQFLIGGPLNGEVTFNSEKGEYEKTTGDHTQFLVYGVAEGVGAPTVFESLELKLDEDYPDFNWGSLAAGDDIVLIQTAPWQTVQFITLPFPHYETTLVGPGQVEYGSSFEGDLQSALDLIRPKLGTGLDVTYTMNPDGLALHIVPEPGTLVLLGVGGVIALIAYVWRKRRCR